MQILSDLPADPAEPGKTAAPMSPAAQRRLKRNLSRVVDEAEVGDYELYVVYTDIADAYQLAVQRKGSDATDLAQQMDRPSRPVGRGSVSGLKAVIDRWLAKYKMLYLASHDPGLTEKYVRIFERIGYPVERRDILPGMAVPSISQTAPKAAKLLIRVEAADYAAQFNQILALVPSARAQVQADVRAEIGWAKQALKKQDRIVWYLRWYRLVLADRLAAQLRLAGDDAAGIEKLAAKYRKEAESKAGGKSYYDASNWRDLKSNLAHLCGLPARAVEDASPGWDLPERFVARLEEIEEEFKESRNDALTIQEGDRIFLDFPDGWAWWLLDRASCGDEAAAMGHCGNSPAAGRDDQRILSLRKKIDAAGKYWSPHCTFILHDGGCLGEMKGRNNEKPTAKYHPYIFALLKDPRIVSVVGGGYRPENNFAVADLTEAERAELKKLKPEMFLDIEGYYKARGMDETLLGRISSTLELPERWSDFEIDESLGGIVLRRYADADDVVQDLGDDETRSAARYDPSDEEASVPDIRSFLLPEIEGNPRLVGAIGRALGREHETLLGREFPDFDPDSAEDLDRALEIVDDATETDSEGDRVPVPSETLDQLKEAYAAGLPSREKAEGLIEDAVDNSQYSDSELDIVGDDGGYALVLAFDTAVAIAARLEKRNDTGYDFDLPYVSVGEDWNQFDAEEAVAALEDLFLPNLERHGQERLFAEPASEAEAEREGIKVSKLLQAGADYKEMFRALLALAPERRQDVEREIRAAKEKLAKQDRVVWYLRWYRLALAEFEKYAATGEAREEIEELAERYRRETNPSGKAFHLARDGNGVLLDDLEHLFALPVEAIRNLDPGSRTPIELVVKLRSLEQEFESRGKAPLPPSDSHLVFLKFPDGWAWFDLNAASCDDEAAAMGHCGNSPAAGSPTQTILSLREPKRYGRETRWEPHLTFILHAGGALGEMKGKGNAKPAARYHRYIVPLLEDRRITGVVGGGYLPENNFSLEDLSPEEIEQIRAKNPAPLTGLKEYAEERGAEDEGVRARVRAKLGAKGEFDGDYVVASWPDIDRFLVDCADSDDVEALLEAVHGTVGYPSSLIWLLRPLANRDGRVDAALLAAMRRENREAFLKQEFHGPILRSPDGDIYWHKNRSDSDAWLRLRGDNGRKIYPGVWNLVGRAAAEATARNPVLAKRLLDEAIMDSVSEGRIAFDGGKVLWTITPEEGLDKALSLGDDQEFDEVPYVYPDHDALVESGIVPDPEKFAEALRAALGVGPESGKPKRRRSSLLAPRLAYLSPVDGEVSVAFDGGARPRALLTLDMGVPALPVFTLRFPLDSDDPEAVSGYLGQAADALIDEMTINLVRLGYSEDLMVALYGPIREAFADLTARSATDWAMPDRDRHLRLYEGTFALPEDFVDETQARIVTAGKVRRAPASRDVELVPFDPAGARPDPGRIIEFERERAGKTTSRPYYVALLDPPGGAASDWEARTLADV